MQCKYTITNGFLRILEAPTNRVIWQGRPDSHTVKKVFELADTNTGIILLYRSQVSKSRSFQNLIAVDCHGNVVWRAELPDSSGVDTYVSASLIDDCLIANSWSCFRVTIDKRTGLILSRISTK